MLANCSYYGDLTEVKPIRTLGEDLARDLERNMIEEMYKMEERIKRHITECKRELVKEFQSVICAQGLKKITEDLPPVAMEAMKEIDCIIADRVKAQVEKKQKKLKGA